MRGRVLGAGILAKGHIDKRGHRAPSMIGLCLTIVLVAGACDGESNSRQSSEERSIAERSIPQPTHAQLAAANLASLPVASADQRVDIAAPTFSDPTTIDNPLFPISNLRSAILSGRVDDKPFHTETTLLPETRIIEWSEGNQVETRVSQYVAYLDGRLQETALDFYAQADDGSVWYFGEEVVDYRKGVIFTTEGTWLAGRDGPPAMIMPGDPQVGDVHRAENIPGVAFEEVAVKAIGKTVVGPTGPVKGALVGSELHDDGTFSDKVFAPSYGEFYSAHQGDVEAMALAVPVDALNKPVPAELEALSDGALAAFDASRSRQWGQASEGVARIMTTWKRYKKGELPPWLSREMNRAVEDLARAVRSHSRTGAGTAAIDVAYSANDLQLRFRSPAQVDLVRLALWARQTLVDAESKNLAGVTGDVATLQWIRRRVAHVLDPVEVTRIDTDWLALSESVADKDLEPAGGAAQHLLRTIASLQ